MPAAGHDSLIGQTLAERYHVNAKIGEGDPFAIGTATHRERRRWLFWKNEKMPLVW